MPSRHRNELYEARLDRRFGRYWPFRFSRRRKKRLKPSIASCAAGESTKRTKEIQMFLTLFAVLLVMWLLGFFAFHVAGGLIHLLLIVALISLVLHFFRGSSTA